LLLPSNRHNLRLMKYIFIDTNVIMHCTAIDQIDWLEEAECDECSIVIAPITLDEADAKKRGTDKISNRARSFLQKIEQVTESSSKELRPRVFLLLQHDKPLPHVYSDNQLNAQEADHRFMASIFLFKHANPKLDVLICSYDTGVRLRAKQHFALNVLRLSDKYVLPPEGEDSERKLKNLEKQLEVLKSKIPKPSLQFKKTAAAYMEIIRRTWRGMSLNEFIQGGMAVVEATHPYIQDVKEASHPFLGTITFEEMRAYNVKLSSFFDAYRIYLAKRYSSDYNRHHSYTLEFTLSNTASYVPADDIDVHFHFPDGFLLLNEDEAFEEEEQEPEPPYRPKHANDLDLRGLGRTILSTPSWPLISIPNPIRPDIKRTNSYDVDFHVGTVKHTYTSDIPAFVILFENEGAIQNFKIDYRISAANLPIPVAGELHVRFIA
jgi:hypothetical protein